MAHVKTLNKSVLAWIQKHVEDKPTCILTPVFEDYEKHLKKIEERFGVLPSDNEDSEPESGNMASTEVGVDCMRWLALLLTLDFARLQNKSPQVSKLTMR